MLVFILVLLFCLLFTDAVKLLAALVILAAPILFFILLAAIR